MAMEVYHGFSAVRVERKKGCKDGSGDDLLHSSGS
jgi:hypothetical protein